MGSVLFLNGIYGSNDVIHSPQVCFVDEEETNPELKTRKANLVNKFLLL